MRTQWQVPVLMVTFFLAFGFAVGGLIYLVRHPHIKVVPVMSEVRDSSLESPPCQVAQNLVRKPKRKGVPVKPFGALPYEVPAVAEQFDLGDTLWPVIVIKGHERTTVMVPRG